MVMCRMEGELYLGVFLKNVTKWIIKSYQQRDII